MDLPRQFLLLLVVLATARPRTHVIAAPVVRETAQPICAVQRSGHHRAIAQRRELVRRRRMLIALAGIDVLLLCEATERLQQRHNESSLRMSTRCQPNERAREHDLLVAVHRAVHHVAKQISRDIVSFPSEKPLDPLQAASIEEIGDHHRVIENVAEHFGGLHGANAAPRFLDLHQRVQAVRQREELLVGWMAVQNAGESA